MPSSREPREVNTMQSDKVNLSAMSHSLLDLWMLLRAVRGAGWGNEGRTPLVEVVQV